MQLDYLISQYKRIQLRNRTNYAKKLNLEENHNCMNYFEFDESEMSDMSV